MPTSEWDRQIMMEAQVWERYGCAVDLRRDRPLEDMEAHAAIVAGKNKEDKKNQKKAEREMNAAS